MKKKIIGIFVFMLLIGTALPVSGTIDTTRNIIPNNMESNTLYVGGSGPNNYSAIQEAVDNASEGDIVFVYDDSSPYYENLNINKLITLKGENRETTIIDGTEIEQNVINIFADNVNILEFTIQRYCNDDSNFTSLINIQSDHNNISNNILIGNISAGIYIFRGEFNILSDNIINDNFKNGVYGLYCNYSYILNNFISTKSSGIFLHFANDNKIIGNNIQYCFDGIVLGATSHNFIYGNVISNNEFSGINSIFLSDNNNISMNEISYNGFYGIFLSNSHNAIVTKNNFIKNKGHAFFLNSQLVIMLLTKDMGTKPFIPKIYWNENYWDNWIGVGSKLIFGRRGFLCKIIWISADLHPVKEPYDIGI